MTHPSDIPAASAAPRAIVPASSYLDWGAIFAGTLVALAAGMVMLAFGSALGLSIVSPEPGEGVSPTWFSIAAGLWFVWVVVSSTAAGAYLAGRLRRPAGETAAADEIEMRDGAQGLSVWALSVVLSGLLAASGIAGITGTAVRATAAAGGGIAEMMAGPLSTMAGQVLLPSEGAAPAPGETAPVSDTALREEIVSIMSAGLATGEVPAEDREYLVARIAAATGETPEVVEERLTAAAARAEAAWEDAQETIDAARRGAVVGAFVIAATLAAAAAAGYFAAVAGGKHRDDNIPFRTLRR